ncbi:MAG: putative DNA-binding protein [Clostridiales bacterium]
MDDIYRLSMLIDFYGQMLTDRQFEVLDLYYNNDYSLTEIADKLSISRQGVYDNLKRGKNLLTQFEEKLELVEKFDKNKNTALNVLKYIDRFDLRKLNDKDKKNLELIKKGVNDIIEND